VLSKHGMIEVNDHAAFPAGLPVLEIIRKLEQEKILLKEERALINEVLQDETRKQLLFKCLKDIEMGANTKFAVRRLKAVVYNNGAGLPIGSQLHGSVSEYLLHVPVSSEQPEIISNKTTLKLHRRDRDINSLSQVSEAVALDTSSAISKVFAGDEPSIYASGDVFNDSPGVAADIMYAPSDNYNVCAKIFKRLSTAKNTESNSPPKFAVLIGSGSFNPLTRMHLRQYYVAKQYLETSYLGYTVLGCLLSPSHATSVRERYKTNPSEIIPSPHRLAIAQMLVEDSSFISVDPWEISRRRPMDYLSMLDHTADMLRAHFPLVDIKVLYLCKGMKREASIS
jgi:hypothetical protein